MKTGNALNVRFLLSWVLSCAVGLPIGILSFVRLHILHARWSPSWILHSLHCNYFCDLSRSLVCTKYAYMVWRIWATVVRAIPKWDWDAQKWPSKRRCGHTHKQKKVNQSHPKHWLNHKVVSCIRTHSGLLDPRRIQLAIRANEPTSEWTRGHVVENIARLFSINCGHLPIYQKQTFIQRWMRYSFHICAMCVFRRCVGIYVEHVQYAQRPPKTEERRRYGHYSIYVMECVLYMILRTTIFGFGLSLTLSFSLPSKRLGICVVVVRYVRVLNITIGHIDIHSPISDGGSDRTSSYVENLPFSHKMRAKRAKRMSRCQSQCQCTLYSLRVYAVYCEYVNEFPLEAKQYVICTTMILYWCERATGQERKQERGNECAYANCEAYKYALLLLLQQTRVDLDIYNELRKCQK